MANLDDTVTISLDVLLDAMPTPTVLVDAHYRIKAANQAYCRVYAISADAVVGKTCHAISHGSPEPCHEHGEACPHHEVFANGRSSTAEHLHRAAHGVERVSIQAHWVRDASGVAYMMETVVAQQIDNPAFDRTPPHGDANPAPDVHDDAHRLHRIEQEVIADLLRQHFSRREIASKLGISERTLYRKLNKYGLCEEAAA